MNFYVSDKRWYCQIDQTRGYCVGKCHEIRVMGDYLQTKGRLHYERNLGHVSRLNESAEEQHSSMYMKFNKHHSAYCPKYYHFSNFIFKYSKKCFNLYYLVPDHY